MRKMFNRQSINAIPIIILFYFSTSFVCAEKIDEFDEFLIFNIGVEHTDNALNNDDDQRIDTLFNFGVNLGADYAGANSTFRADYKLNSTEYLEDSFDRDQRELGEIYFDVHSKKQIFTWFIQQRSEEVLIGVSDDQPTVPNGRSQRLTQSTGPIINLNFSARDSLSLSSVKSISMVDDTNADSDSLSNIIRYEHLFSKKTSLELSLTQSIIEPESFVINGMTVNEFDQLSRNIKLTRKIRVGEFFIRVGDSTVDDLGTGSSGGTIDSPTYQFGLNINGAFGRFNIDFLQDLTDSSIASEFISEFSQATDNVGDVAAPEFVIERRNTWQFSYSTSALRSRHGWTFYFSRQENEDETGGTEDRILNEYRIEYKRALSRSTSIVFNGSRYKGDARGFGGAGIEDIDQKRLGVNIRFDLSKRLASECGVLREDFSGQTGFQNSSSNNAFCSLSYTAF